MGFSTNSNVSPAPSFHNPKNILQEKISSSKVLMFSKDYCPYCDQAKAEFKRVGVAYDIVELNKLPDGADQQTILKDITGQNTVPNIFIGGQHVGGFSDLKAKLQSGKIEQLLNGAGVPHKLYENKIQELQTQLKQTRQKMADLPIICRQQIDTEKIKTCVEKGESFVTKECKDNYCKYPLLGYIPRTKCYFAQSSDNYSQEIQKILEQIQDLEDKQKGTAKENTKNSLFQTNFSNKQNPKEIHAFKYLETHGLEKHEKQNKYFQIIK